MQARQRESASRADAAAQPAVGEKPPAEARETGGRRLVVPAPGLLQRVLLTTDGTVGHILEAYAEEPIEIAKLEQWSAPCGADNHALELAPDDEALRRRVILRGGETGRSFVYAESLIALERLHPRVRRGLLDTSAPIGKLLTSVRAETFREILSMSRAPAGTLGVHFALGAAEELFSRTYRIVSGRRPIMLITEKFPTTWFLD